MKHKSEKIYNLYLVITDGGEEGMTFDLFIPPPFCHLVSRVELVTPRFHLHRTDLSAREGDLIVGERDTLPTGDLRYECADDVWMMYELILSTPRQ